MKEFPMRGKRAALVAGVCATVAMGAVDTLKVKKMFQLVKDNATGLTYQLHSLGAVQNGIIYGTASGLSNISGGTPNDGVLVWDANVGLYGFKGEISRPGSNFDGTFPMKLKGDTLIYTDSTDLIAALVSDPENPVQLWKKTYSDEIARLTWANTDTFYVSDINDASVQGFHTSVMQGSSAPTILSSFGWMHTGLSSYLLNDKFIRITTNKISTWVKPFTDRAPDSSATIATMVSGKYSPGFISAATQGNYSYCATTVKTYVYDHTNMSAFALKDSLQGGGSTMLIYKDLLIVGGGGFERC